MFAAAAFFTVAVLLHNADHVRRGADTINTDVFAAGTLAILFEVGAVLLIVQRHRLAPLAATAVGFGLAAGYVVTHFLPQRAWLSDSLVSATDASPLSWAAASLEVLAALAVGVTGWLALRDNDGLASAARPVADTAPLGDALRHPFVLALVIGNALVLVVSFLQL